MAKIEMFPLQVDGKLPIHFKAAFDTFFEAINVIDKYEQSNTKKAIKEGLLQKIFLDNRDTAKFFPSVTEGVITISHRFMFYLYSYSFCLYLLCEHVMRREIDKTWNGIPDSSNEVRWADIFLANAKEYRDGKNTWNEELINPEMTYIATKDVNVLFGMEMCFIFLHEIAHLLLKHDPKMENEEKILAEKDADLSAITVFFNGIEDYAIKRNRAIAIGVLQAASLYTVIDPRRLKSKTHPDKDVRMANLMDYIKIDDLKADYYLKTIVGLGIHLFCSENKIVIEEKEFETATDHYEYLLSKIADEKGVHK